MKTFEILEMDKDSNYLGITGENVENLSKPELREDFKRNEHNWFVTPHAPQRKRTPGLFKVEFKGNKMIGLCSKSYCTELFATKNSPAQVKISIIGVNKGQFKNPMPHYKHVLNTKQNFRACNQGIHAKDESMVTYKQDKNALTYFCPKRKSTCRLTHDCTFGHLRTLYMNIYSICHAHGLCI